VSWHVPDVLVGHRLIVVDVEGNGARIPEIVEVAMLRLGGVVHAADMSTWLVQPRTPISAAVTRKVHGIRNCDVAGKPLWTEIADEVSALLRDRIIVAHNASVERAVLQAHLPEWRVPVVIDTLRLAKHVWPGRPDGYGLDALITHGGWTAPPGLGVRHRAAFDAWMTARLLATLVEESGLGWSDIVRVAALPKPKLASDLRPEQGALW
jgi:DNA polymerase III epsilon subunit-like protein